MYLGLHSFKYEMGTLFFFATSGVCDEHEQTNSDDDGDQRNEKK